MQGIPTYGVEMFEGLPGSGKSLACVELMLDELERLRRPFYTNLPLRWRVIKAYLRKRGGEPLASLLQPLSKEHFVAFCKRQTRRQEFRDARKDFRKNAPTATRERDLEREFVLQAGPEVIGGVGANWIPAGSIICIDEVHRWFPQERQKDLEPEELRAYVTMHRHHFHLIRLATQDRMQVSLTFRRNLQRLFVVHNKGEDPICWGVKFKHLGWNAIGYAEFNGDQLKENGLKMEQKPVSERVMFPGAPWNQFLFRLYDSFSHVGSPAKLRRDLAAARLDAGLASDGSIVRKQVIEGPPTVKKRVFESVRRSLWWAAKWTLRVSLASACVTLGVVAGRGCGAKPAAKDVRAPVVEKLQWGKWQGVSGDGVRIDGQKYKVGGVLKNGAKIRMVSQRPRALVLERGDRVFAWAFGEAEPRDVGTRDAVLRAVDDVKRRAARGGGDAGQTDPQSGQVGSPQSVPLGE